jgi:hypothetical protein
MLDMTLCLYPRMHCLGGFDKDVMVIWFNRQCDYYSVTSPLHPAFRLNQVLAPRG